MSQTDEAPTVAAVAADLEKWAPLALAEEWDNVGLLLGDPDAAVSRIITCLTLTPDVAAEAVETGAQLIVTHHPILFRPVKRLTNSTTDGRIVLALAKAGIAVYSAHTAYDNAEGGINNQLADRLTLGNVGPLRRQEDVRNCKIVVFVPDADLAKVSDAMFAAGGGIIGEYRECSFRVSGTGTFFGGASTNPSVGEKGRREELAEWRLEVVCPESAVDGIVSAMRAAHSYEEPAYDVYSLRPAKTHGAGRIGQLSTAIALSELAARVRKMLHSGPVQVVGELNRSIRRIAVACGAAGEFLADAGRAGADAFLTGEMRFHDFLAARANGIALIVPGHYATERFAMEALAARLGQRWPAVQVTASRREADPVGWA